MKNTKRIGLGKTLFMLLVFCCLQTTKETRAQAIPPSPVTFYQGLAAAIDKAQGHFLLDMNGGKYKLTVNSKELRINVNAGTEMESTFHYENQALRSATVVFKPEINVFLLGSSGFSCKLRSLEYNSNGGIVGSDCQIDNPGNPGQPGNFSNVNRHLELSTRSEDMFLGSPFAQSDRIKGCNNQFGNCTAKDLFNRVRFLRSPESPALLVTLKEGATIFLSRARPGTTKTFENFVTLGAGGSFEFQDLIYELDGDFVKGKLDNFKLSVRRGEINAGNANFKLRDGSRVDLNQVKFSRDGSTGESIIDARNGSIDASVGQGSTVALTTGISNISSLILDDGSSVNIVGLRYEIDDQRATTLSFANGSTLNMNIFGGRLAVGPNGYVQLQNGRFAAKMQGLWESGTRPDITGTVETLDVGFSSGEFDLNAQSHVRLSGGRLRAAAGPGIPGLVINSQTLPVITGQFESVLLSLSEDSVFMLPGNMRMTTNAGGTFKANDSASPFRIEAGVLYPIGRFELDLPFKKLTNASQANLALSNGQIKLPLENFRDGSIKNIPNRKVEFSGTMNLTVPDSTVTASIPVSITEGVVDIVPGQRQRFDGVWSTNIVAGLSFDIKTPFIRDIDIDGDGDLNSDARVFPLNLRVTLAQNLPIRNIPIAFDGNVVTTSVALEPTLFLQVGEGGGKYKDPNNPNAGTEGGDGFANWQEAFRDDVLTSTIHFYLEPKTYTFNSKVNISIGVNGLDVAISEIRTNEQISWKKNGGDLVQIFGFLGAIISTAAAGNPLPGVIIGGLLGGTMEERLQGVISRRIAEKIQSVRREWHIQT